MVSRLYGTTRGLYQAIESALTRVPISALGSPTLRALIALYVTGLVQRLGVASYLCLDDVIIEKAYARRLPWVAWTYSFAKKRKVYGLHSIVVLWCSHDGPWRIPVSFRLWRPKRRCAPQRSQTKPELR